MKEYNFSYKFSSIPPIMRRGKHVLIVVKDDQGKYILGSKKIYPEGIYRFIGGGVDLDENPAEAAVREIEEELKINVRKTNFRPLAKFIVEVSDEKETFVFLTFLFLLTTPVSRQLLVASDDLDDLVELSKDEVLELVQKYENLSDCLVDLKGDKSGLFKWSDYGKFYSQVHQIAMELA
ncbi:MAG: NUDIX hydrolase [Patescibacteria group bacterium]|nr:NUDIX hydrolase [Patescibacteria group bacterium]